MNTRGKFLAPQGRVLKGLIAQRFAELIRLLY